jgi:hypothetical protein
VVSNPDTTVSAGFWGFFLIATPQFPPKNPARIFSSILCAAAAVGNCAALQNFRLPPFMKPWEMASKAPVDVIATFGSPATQAAKQATTTIPIVMVAVGDAVRAGFVASLAHPGGNITGNRPARPAADRRSVFPEVSKPIRRKLAVSDGMLDVLVAGIVFPSVKVDR